MLSNIYYLNDSCGSDSVDSLFGTDSSTSDEIRFSANLDHNYKQSALKTCDDPFFNQNSQQIIPLMSEQLEQLFDLGDMTAFEDMFEFASAPTPPMSNCCATLDDIESGDLLVINSNEIKPIVDSNNITFDLPFVENEVEIPIAVNSLLPLEGQVSQSAQISVPNEVYLYSRPQHSRHGNPNKRIKTSESYAQQFSDTDDEEEEEETETQPKRKSKPGRKPNKGSNKCMSRNAIAARENRERKKAYIENMEKIYKISDDENRKMKSIIISQSKKIEELTEQNKYYRGVLANDSMISQLIRQLSDANPIELIGNQMMSTKGNHTIEVTTDSKVRKSSRIAASKTDTSQTSGHRLKVDTESSGICLHVHNNEVSLEFCAKCSVKHKKAK